ncbi:MAG TPA: transcriptional regulator [Cyanobacteria bacterium UBA11369]|nr:transcriptional regulator [Cyanobacteria bacterium UBA11371]HBE36874.1 transcriptional regulator [Cyanobacteria bacterium UBA11368]HBE54123.1 transcriptional regulator [Cyanobacteria bacterium UBA11369]
MSANLAPNPEESLAEYVKRLRTSAAMTQEQLSAAAGLHRQSLTKIEAGKTTRLSKKAKAGLAAAFLIPTEYLDAVAGDAGAIAAPALLKLCPQCWIPGTAADPMWTDLRSRYCFACGSALVRECRNCHQPITSHQHRFCPYCGLAYKNASATPTNVRPASPPGSGIEVGSKVG